MNELLKMSTGINKIKAQNRQFIYLFYFNASHCIFILQLYGILSVTHKTKSSHVVIYFDLPEQNKTFQCGVEMQVGKMLVMLKKVNVSILFHQSKPTPETIKILQIAC